MQTQTFQIRNFTFTNIDTLYDDSKSPYSTQASEVSLSYKKVSFESQKKFEASFQSFSQSHCDQQGQTVETEVFQWFQRKSIKVGNPQEIVQKYNHQQKKFILSKVENEAARKVASVKCIGGIEVGKNSLLQRRVRRNTICH